MGDINSSEISSTLGTSDYFLMSIGGKLRRIKVNNSELKAILALSGTTLLCENEATTLTQGVDYNVGDTLEFVCLNDNTDKESITWQGTTTDADGNESFIAGMIDIPELLGDFTYNSTTIEVTENMKTFTVNEYVSVYRSAKDIIVDTELSEESTDPVQNKVVAKKINQLSEEIADLGQNGTGGGLTDEEKNLILTLFQNAVFTTDQRGNIQALYNLFFGSSEEITVTGISLSHSELTFEDMNSKNLTATLSPSGATGIVTWSSSNEEVAKVSQIGAVTPVADGSCVITASINDYSASCNITVKIAVSINITQDGSTLTIIDAPNVTQNGTTLVIE